MINRRQQGLALVLLLLAGSSVSAGAWALDWPQWVPMRRAKPTPAHNAPVTVPPRTVRPETAPAAIQPVPSHPGVVIETERGNITFQLYTKDAPMTVAHFSKLVSQGFYNQGMQFHRVVPGFVVQTGDPTNTGMGGSSETIALEVRNKLSHQAKGVVAMARSADPNSARSQFYITLAPQTSLDGKYAIFGRVVDGLNVLETIRQGDRLYGARLVDLDQVLPGGAARLDQRPSWASVVKQKMGFQAAQP